MTDAMRARYEGAFLDALDLPEGVLVPVEIEAVAEPNTEKDSRGKLIDLAILAFRGKTKRLILGKTSWKNIKAMFGPNHKDWLGKKIAIQRRYLTAAQGFGQHNCLCIRVVPPRGTPILKSAANFMGSSTPYDEHGQPTQPKATPPKPATPPKATTEPAPAEPTELEMWIRAVAMLPTLDACSEFQRETLPQCPAEWRPAVEAALIERTKEVPE